MQRDDRYILRTSADVLDTVASFCRYYDTIHHHIEAGTIVSSVDRGAFTRPHDLLPPLVLDLLEGGRNSLSFAYGPEAGAPELRHLVACVENRRHGTRYGSDNVAVVSGAWGGVNLAIEQAFDLGRGVRPAGPIVIVGPTHYQLFHRAINVYGIDVFALDFVLDDPHVPTHADELAEVWDLAPRVLFLTNPNNPDARYLDPAVVRATIERAERENCIVIIDEIQDCFTRPGSAGLDYGPWIEAEHVVRIDSYSKKRALADYRVGWVLASPSFLGTRTTGLIGRLSGFMGNAPRAANTALRVLLEGELDRLEGAPDLLAPGWSELERRRDHVDTRLDGIDGVRRLRTDACVSTVIDVDVPLRAMDLSEHLMKRGTLIMPCTGYGYDGHRSVMRFTFAERWAKLDHALDQLEEVVGELRAEVDA